MSETTSYNNVPSEIGCNIFQQLSQSDLFECQKVCKSWYLSTKRHLWENIQLRTVENVDSFLKYSLKDAEKIVKNIIIGKANRYPEEYILSKVQLKKLLFSLSNLEKIQINIDFLQSALAELNDEEFLMELRNSCPSIKSFDVHTFSVSSVTAIHPEAYGNIVYYLRDTITSIIISYHHQNVFQHIQSFPRLEYLTIYECRWTLTTFMDFLYKIKMLPQLKYLKFFTTFINPNELQKMDMRRIIRIIDKDQALKEKLASIEILHLYFDYTAHYFTNFVIQYFVGLKEIEISYSFHLNPSDDILSNEWANFISSHDKYNWNISNIHSTMNHSDTIRTYLHNHFINNSTNNRNTTKHLNLALCNFDPNDYNIYPYGQVIDDIFELHFESKNTDNGQLLKLLEIELAYSEDFIDYIFEKLSSIKYVMNNMDTLSFVFFGEDENSFVSNVLRLIDQLLSWTTDTLKKVKIEIEDDYRWSKYFAKYEKVKIYRQVKHLEIFVQKDTDELLDEFVLSQFISIFPCIKYLTLGPFYDIHRDCTLRRNKLFINLPQISLKKLSLGAIIPKKMAQDVMKTEKYYFMLNIETDKRSYYYEVSLDLLNVIELSKGDERNIDIKKSIQVYIVLKDIECIEIQAFVNAIFICTFERRVSISLKSKVPKKHYS